MTKRQASLPNKVTNGADSQEDGKSKADAVLQSQSFSTKVSPAAAKQKRVLEVETVAKSEDEGDTRSSKHFKVDAKTTCATAVASESTDPVVTPTTAAAAAVSTTSSKTPIDLANTLGYKEGSRLEVQWEIHDDDSQETKTVWWKATLLEHDGRFTDDVAIRSLYYDARPDLGFPEPSKEDVVFMGHDWLVNPDDPEVHMRYKKEGLTEEENQVVQCSDEQLEEQLNQIMMGALAKQQQAWKAMPAAMQAMIGEKMKGMKEKLKQKLQMEAKKGHVITSETIKELLDQSF